MALPIYSFVTPSTDPSLFRELAPYGPAADGGFNAGLTVGMTVDAIDAGAQILAPVDGYVWVVPQESWYLSTILDLVLVPSPAYELAIRDSMIPDGRIAFVFRGLGGYSVVDAFVPRMGYVPSLPPEEAGGWTPVDFARGPFWRITLEPRTLGDLTDPSNIGTYLRSQGADDNLISAALDLYLGSSPEWVAAGESIGVGARDDWHSVTVEIVHLPHLWGLEGGRDRLHELAAPDSPTRRLDPAAFYRALPALRRDLGTIALEAAPEHGFDEHALFQTLTHRVLLELRDEYDHPYIGAVAAEVDGSGATHHIPPEARGTLVLAGGDPGIGVSDPETWKTCAAAIEDHVLTELPSGGTAADRAERNLRIPAHWSMQAVFMADKDDDRSWFVANAAPLRRFTAGNAVEPLIDGRDAFRQMVDAFLSVNHRTTWLYFSNWWYDDKFQLVEGERTTTMRRITRRIARDGGKVRALIWKNLLPPHLIRHWFAVERLRALPWANGFAILDADHPIFGSHHQKFAVVNGRDHAVAFLGGIDFNTNRLDDPAHEVERPYHDLHAQIRGPAVADIAATFEARWNNRPAGEHYGWMLAWDPVVPPPDDPAEPDILYPPLPTMVRRPRPRPLPRAALRIDAPGSSYVQVARTFAPKRRYPFVSRGEDLTSLQALLRAIDRAERFIYVEDQYGWPYSGELPYSEASDDLGVTAALRRALLRPGFEHLIFVLAVAGDDPFTRRYGPVRRARFFLSLIDGLPSDAREKVHAFTVWRGTGTLTEADAGAGMVPLEVLERLEELSEAELASLDDADLRALLEEHPPSTDDQIWEAIAATPEGLDEEEQESWVTEHLGYGEAGAARRGADIYVHSKVWIIDDVFAKIGSTNCNFRSLTHDSEIDISLIDDTIHQGGRPVAQALRIALWGEHLGIPEVARYARLEDPTYALTHWFDPPEEARIVSYDPEANLDGPVRDLLWKRIVDPDGRG